MNFLSAIANKIRSWILQWGKKKMQQTEHQSSIQKRQQEIRNIQLHYKRTLEG